MITDKDMVKELTFNPKDVKCNGSIGGCAVTLTKENEEKVKSCIDGHFSLVDKFTAIKNLEIAGKIDTDWVIGSRAESTQQLFCRMVSGLISYGLKVAGRKGGTYKAQREFADVWTNQQVQNMNTIDLVTILESALIDCASADYYYEFEKEWS